MQFKNINQIFFKIFFIFICSCYFLFPPFLTKILIFKIFLIFRNKIFYSFL
nr:MAG TPA: hypothetical protein [Caudoviricetes sp.]